jgi:uncharacterized protein with HEPN domain
VRSYEIIGEICKRLPEDMRKAHPEVDWRKLTGFRDYLAHNYEYILLRYVWEAVEDVPRLKAAINEILKALPPEA